MKVGFASRVPPSRGHQRTERLHVIGPASATNARRACSIAVQGRATVRMPRRVRWSGSSSSTGKGGRTTDKSLARRGWPSARSGARPGAMARIARANSSRAVPRRYEFAAPSDMLAPDIVKLSRFWKPRHGVTDDRHGASDGAGCDVVRRLGTAAQLPGGRSRSSYVGASGCMRLRSPARSAAAAHLRTCACRPRRDPSVCVHCALDSGDHGIDYLYPSACR